MSAAIEVRNLHFRYGEGTHALRGVSFSIAEGEHAWMFWRWPTAVRWNRIFSIVR